MSWALDEAPVTDSTQALVLLCLADWADDTGLCWPAVESIARRARCSETTARRHVRALERAGIVVRMTASNGRTSNRYRIIMRRQPGQIDRVGDNSPYRGDENTPSPAGTMSIHRADSEPGQIDRVDVVTLASAITNPGAGDTPTLAPVAPEPSMNHQEPPAAPGATTDQSWMVDSAAAAAASMTDEDLDPSRQRVDELREAIRDAGLGARWDRLTGEHVLTIARLVDVHGTKPLVDTAITLHRDTNPARFAQAWIGAWLAKPIPAAAQAPRPECTRDDCDHGWLDDNELGQAVRCPDCHPNR
ncbi:helix-turn-helix domain-containing protein [Rhodococcus sp. D2-41]|uniref:helix-turn-helix domain-containing protein n=1 Tax=Speluncibacter jeojiensis TaxID=2710754 RepID=UPI0024107FC1|nr:helix-turn-helix domain-containing protein [Rhodococcus sp. D2-41]MDG3012710.1 helix-turn-helix domain-containing protein [Rhodococcus sp. D2-41]